MSGHDADWVALSDLPIDAVAVRAWLNRAAPEQRGGICVFEGCTRGERHTAHGELVRLDYQAYSAMAVKQMLALAGEARRRWPVGALAMVHRTGAVAVGEASVIIGVACGHRGDAFEACRWLIDALKHDVTIWKQEVWRDGATTWSEAAVHERR